MKVWVVYCEYAKASDGDAAVVVSVHQSKAGAEAAREAEIKTQHEEYHNQVWGDEPPEPVVDADDNCDWDEADWDVDVHIEEQELEP